MCGWTLARAHARMGRALDLCCAWSDQAKVGMTKQPPEVQEIEMRRRWFSLKVAVQLGYHPIDGPLGLGQEVEVMRE